MEHIDIAPERSSRPHHPVARALGLTVGGVLAVYLVGRGIAEFFTVNYNDPASYRLDWGGPSLAGVFAVHTGRPCSSWPAPPSGYAATSGGLLDSYG